jgi:hypothetical protein
MAHLDFPAMGNAMTSLVAFVHPSNLDTAQASFSPNYLDRVGDGTTKSGPEAIENLVTHTPPKGCHLVTSGCETFTERVLDFLTTHDA